MAANNSLYGQFLDLINSPGINWNYTPATLDPSGKSGRYLNQIGSLPGTSMGLRNRALATTLNQLAGPGLAGVNAAGGADRAASDYRQQQVSGVSNLYSRGLQGSGAMPLLDRSLYNMYGANLAGVEQQAQAGDLQRKMDLLGSLQDIISGDVQFRNTVIGGDLATQQAKQASDSLAFNKLMGLIGNVAGLGIAGAGALAKLWPGGLGPANTAAGAFPNWSDLGTSQNFTSGYLQTPAPGASTFGFGGGYF